MYLFSGTTPLFLAQPAKVVGNFIRLFSVFGNIQNSYVMLKRFFMWLEQPKLLFYITRIQASLEALNIKSLPFVHLDEAMDKCRAYHDKNPAAPKIINGHDKISAQGLSMKIDEFDNGRDFVEETGLGPEMRKLIRDFSDKFNHKLPNAKTVPFANKIMTTIIERF